jgi:hypothetical protein
LREEIQQLPLVTKGELMTAERKRGYELKLHEEKLKM